MKIVTSSHLEVFKTKAKRIAAQDNKASLNNPILAVDAMCLYVWGERGERYQSDSLEWKILKGAFPI